MAPAGLTIGQQPVDFSTLRATGAPWPPATRISRNIVPGNDFRRRIRSRPTVARILESRHRTGQLSKSDRLKRLVSNGMLNRGALEP